MNVWQEERAYIRNVYDVLVGKSQGNRPHGIPWRRCEDNIKMDLKEAGCVCGLDSTGSGYSPVTGSCKRGNETSCSIKGGEFLD